VLSPFSMAQPYQTFSEAPMTSRRVLPSVLSLLFLCSSLFAQNGQKRGPSTPEERAKAVQTARALEVDPLQPGNKDMRTWFTLWLIEVPDISVQVCGEELGPVFHESNRDKNFVSEIFGQSMFSSASFIIEHPDQAKDAVAVYTAGVEGSLRAYQSILKTHPEARWPFLDDLIVKQQNGELTKFVEKATAKCRKHH
jgi:carboxypeptidase Q